MTHPEIPKLAWRLFGASLVVYSLFAFERLIEPSPHFHFTDLAHSFLDGRLDTDTPRVRWDDSKHSEDLRDAVRRATTDANGNPTGWNDWASYYRIQLRETGEWVTGVWPWKNQEGRKNEFHTLNGVIRFVDRDEDVARTCGENQRSRCLEKVYQISFPPFPAIAFLPGAWIWGYDFNDVVFTVVLAAANVSLMFLWLCLLATRGYSNATLESRLWLSAAFGFGTAVFFSSVRGEVWFTAQIMGCTLHLLYLLAGLDGRFPLRAGLALACGFATRTPLVFAAAYIGLEILAPSGSSVRWRSRVGRVFQFGLPCLGVGLTLLWMNWVRWENPTEFGHTYLAEGTRASIRDYGLFHPHFLERNIRVVLAGLPTFVQEAPYLRFSKHGIGLFIGSPFLLWAFSIHSWNRQRYVLSAAALVVLLPALFYQNTGWEQYAYRFSIDALPLWIGALSIGISRTSRLLKGAIVFSMLVQGFGAVIFGRFETFF